MLQARQRVVVTIKRPETWTQDMYTAVQGANGTVVDVSTHHSQGAPRDEPYVLVRFDAPVRHRRGTSMAWHFDQSELTPL